MKKYLNKITLTVIELAMAVYLLCSLRMDNTYRHYYPYSDGGVLSHCWSFHELHSNQMNNSYYSIMVILFIGVLAVIVLSLLKKGGLPKWVCIIPCAISLFYLYVIFLGSTFILGTGWFKIESYITPAICVVLVALEIVKTFSKLPYDEVSGETSELISVESGKGE